jgi:hypothetical protein
MTALGDKVRAKLAAKWPKFQVDATVSDDGGTFSAATGAVSGSPTSYAVKSSPPAEYASKYVDGDRIRAGDVEIVLLGAAVVGFTPKPGWKIQVGGVVYRIIGVTHVKPDEATAAFVLQGRV